MRLSCNDFKIRKLIKENCKAMYLLFSFFLFFQYIKFFFFIRFCIICVFIIIILKKFMKPPAVSVIPLSLEAFIATRPLLFLTQPRFFLLSIYIYTHTEKDKEYKMSEQDYPINPLKKKKKKKIL